MRENDDCMEVCVGAWVRARVRVCAGGWGWVRVGAWMASGIPGKPVREAVPGFRRLYERNDCRRT